MAERSAVSRFGVRPLAVAVSLLVGVVAVPLATSEVSAAPALPTQASTACLSVSPPPSGDPSVGTIAPYSNERSPLLLPAWADAAGWANPSQYETILAGDLDGDGYGDLLGRNASVLETHTWSPPLRPGAGGVTDPNASPFPGQWIPKRAADPPQVPEVGTQASMLGETFEPGKQVQARLATVVPGFADPSRYETFRLGNVDGAPGDEVLVLQPRFADAPTDAPVFWPTGSGAPPLPPTYLGTYLAMYRYEAATGSWSGPVWGPPVPDSPPIADGAAPGGSSVPFGHQDSISGNGWWWEQFYDTLTVVDVDGDGTDEIITRGPDLTRSGIDPTAISAGLTTWSFDAASGSFEPLVAPQNLMDTAQGFARDNPWQYSTLRTGDLDPTVPGDELVAQFLDETATDSDLPANGAGLQLYAFDGIQWTYQASSPGAQNATLGAWSTDQSWTQQPAFYETIGVADLVGDGQGEAVFALEPDGLKAYRFDGTDWQPLIGASSPNVLTGANWTGSMSDPSKDAETAPYYSTIQAADVIGTPTEEILARDVDGIHVLSYDPTAKAFRDLGISPTTADGVALSDAAGWNAPMRYDSITTAPTEPGRPRALIARDLTGVRTYVLPDAQATRWVSPSAPYPAWANGTDAAGYVDAGTAAGYPAARAYNFVNEEVGDQLWPVPTYPGQPAVLPDTIRSRYLDLGQDMGTVADRVASLRPRGLNITRAEWEDVQQQMGDWTLSVQRLRAYFFDSSGASSLEQILESSLVVGNTAYSADVIKDQFHAQGATKLWALLGDLLWGVFGGLPTGGSAELGFLFSMAGAGAGMAGTATPSSKYQQALNIEVQDLDEAIAASFCQAIEFLYGSHDQAAADLGLLTAMDIAISENPVTSQVAVQAQTAATRGRAVWIYQQLAAMANPKDGGWQMAMVPAVCVENIYTPGCYAQSQTLPTVNGTLADGALVGAYYAYPANEDCSVAGSGLQTDAFTTLTGALGVDPLDLASPSWTYWSGDVGSQAPGQPQLRTVTVGAGGGAEKDLQVVGALGWRNQVLDLTPLFGIGSLLQGCATVDISIGPLVPKP